MLSLALPVNIYLCVQRTDMRKSFNGLWALAVERLGRDPLATAVAKYTQTAPKLADWMEGNVSESLTVFCLPARHRVRMRTSNMLERLNREITRRTRVVSIFPNDDALLRLASAVLMEADEDWMAGRKYLTMETN